MKRKSYDLNTCFISAAFGANITKLTRVLDRVGVEWEWAKEGFDYAARLPGDLRQIIRRVAFVVAVVFGDRSDASVLFEVGIAVGLGKPTLLFLANDATAPSDIAGLLYVKTSLDDEKALAFHLDLFMRRIKRGSHYPASPSIHAPSKKQDPPRPELNSLIATASEKGSSFEQELVAFIERAGGHIVSQPHSHHAALSYLPDAVFWLPISDPELLNPIAVEVKGSVAHLDFAGLQDKMAKYLRQTGLRTGIILTPRPAVESLPDIHRSPVVNVFLLDFAKFQQLLLLGTLGDYLRQERNRAAHGLR